MTIVVSRPSDFVSPPSEDYKLTISYAHLNPIPAGDAGSGFEINNWDGSGRRPITSGDPLYGVVKSVTNNASAKTITYTIDKESFVGASTIGVNVDFIATSNASNASAIQIYDGEQLRVSSQLFIGTDAASNQESLYAQGHLPNAEISPRLKILSPSQLPAGASTGRFSLINFGSILIQDYNMTIDLSGIRISAGGIIKTYAEWLADPSPYTEAPLVLTKANSDALEVGSGGLNTKLTLTGGVGQYLSSSVDLNYTATADFSGSAFIDIYNATGYGAKYTLSYHSFGRGPEVVATQYNNRTETRPDVFATISTTYYPQDSMITAVSVKPTYTILRLLRGSLNYAHIQPDSYKYEDKSFDEQGYLYHQPLFRLQINTPRNAVMAAGTSDTFTVTVPDGVTLTHVRIPNLTDPTSTAYTSVSCGGIVYAPGSLIELATPVTSPGALTMTINELQYVKGSDYLLNQAVSITFFGVTQGLTPGGSVTFTVDDPNKAPTGNTLSVSSAVTQDGKHYVSPSVGTGVFIKNVQGNLQSISGSVEKGKSIVISSSVQAYIEPDASMIYNSPLDLTNPLLPDPVGYFSVPAGLEIKGVTLSGAATDFKGVTIGAITQVFDNAGEFAASGGKLVEVKLTGPGGSELMLTNSSVSVYLELGIPLDYEDNSLTWYGTSTAWNTWSDRAQGIFTTGGGGSNRTLALPQGATGKLGQSVISNSSTTIITFSAPIKAETFSSVYMDDVYKSYDVANTASTVPERYAGSTGGDFKVYVYYGLPATVTNARAYFFLPRQLDWRPVLSDQPTVRTSNGIAPYTLYYTTDTSVIGKSVDAADGSLVDDVTWTQLNVGSVSATDIPNITGIKYSFTELKQGDNLTMNLPFGIPAVNGEVEYDTTAIGVTPFWFSGSNAGLGATAAVKLIRSQIPKVREAAGVSDAAISPADDVYAYQQASGSPLAWDDVITYDDVTSGVAIRYINVQYAPQGGTGVTYNTTFGAFTSAVYTPEEGALGYRSRIDFDSSESASDYVNLNKPGTYIVTYTSGNDDDSQQATATRTIKVNKQSGTLTTTPGAVSYFYNQTAAQLSGDDYATFDGYFRSLFEIGDIGVGGGLVDANGDQALDVSLTGISDLLDGGRALDVSEASNLAVTPGRYAFTYTYDDGYDNTIEGVVTVIVKYRGTVTATVKTTQDEAVSGAALTLFGLPGSETTATGTYGVAVEATDADPTGFDWTFTLTGLPEGMTMPTGSALVKTGRATLDGDDEALFVIAPERYPVSVITGTGSAVYSGSVQTGPVTAELQGTLHPGHYLDVLTALGEGQFAGDYPAAVKNFVIRDRNNGDAIVDTDAYYDVDYQLGVFTIAPRTITVRVKDESKVYDGSALKAKTVLLDSASQPLGAGDSLSLTTLTLSGGQTDAGVSHSSAAGAGIMHGSQLVTSSYIIRYTEGDLTVTPRPITVKPVDKSKVYDGKSLKADDIELAGGTLVSGHKLNGSAALHRGSQTAVGKSNSTVTGAKVTGANGSDLTSNYVITNASGKLTVTAKDEPPVDPPVPPVVPPVVPPTPPTPVDPPTVPDAEVPPVPPILTPVTPTPSVVVAPPADQPEPINPAQTAETSVSQTMVVQAATESGIPILPGGIPLIAPAGFETWALINLILAIASVILIVLTLIASAWRARRRSGEDYGRYDGEGQMREGKTRTGFLIFAAILSVVSVVLFLFTQDMKLPMVLADIWTIVFAALFAAEILFVKFTGRKDRREAKEAEAGAEAV
jgi:hypothetical protein